MCTAEEKRRISRADYTIGGQVRYKERLINGEIRNFSLSGFLFHLDEGIDVSEGEQLIVMVDFDGEVHDMVSEINCTVMRSVNHILGLKFDIIDYDTLMFLKEKLIDITGDENKVNNEFFKFSEGN